MRFSLFCLLILTITSCSLLQNVVQMKKATVTTENLRIRSLSFEDIELQFDLIIDNPNALSLRFSKLTYDVLLESRTFINGAVDKSFEVEALNKSKITIPIKLIYKNILTRFADLVSKDELNYAINCETFLTIPVIGDIKIPISVSGKIPLPKFPKIEILSLQKSNINLLGVDLTLNLKINNPNFFNLKIPDFNYRFSLNNSEILNGENSIDIQAKSETILPFKVRLNFIQLGQSIIKTLQNGGEMLYQFQSNMTLEGKLDMLWKKPHQFELNGKITLN